MPLDLYRIQSATDRANNYREDTIQKVTDYLIEDNAHAQRLEEHMCQWCFYRMTGAVAGQAITSYTCALCGDEYNHHNTGVPSMCVECSQETGLCVRCCGDIEGKQRRKMPKASKS